MNATKPCIPLPDQKPPTRPFAAVASFGAIFLWCWSGLCFHFGTKEIGVTPFLALSMLIGVATGLVAQICSGQRIARLFRLPLRVFVAGFFGIALQTLCLVSAVHLAPEDELGQVVLTNYLWPICMVVLSLWLLDEKARPLWVLCGALLGFAGVVLASGPEKLGTMPSSLLPYGLTGFSAFFWALYSVLLKRWHVPEDQGGSTIQFIAIIVMSSFWATWQSVWPTWDQVSGAPLFWIVVSGLGPMGLAYYWWEVGVKRGAAHLAATLANAIPVGSAIIIGLSVGEAMNLFLIPGALLIAGGAWLGRQAMTDSLDSPIDDNPSLQASAGD